MGDQVNGSMPVLYTVLSTASGRMEDSWSSMECDASGNHFGFHMRREEPSLSSGLSSPQRRLSARRNNQHHCWKLIGLRFAFQTAFHSSSLLLANSTPDIIPEQSRTPSTGANMAQDIVKEEGKCTRLGSTSPGSQRDFSHSNGQYPKLRRGPRNQCFIWTIPVKIIISDNRVKTLSFGQPAWDAGSAEDMSKGRWHQPINRARGREGTEEGPTGTS